MCLVHPPQHARFHICKSSLAWFLQTSTHVLLQFYCVSALQVARFGRHCFEHAASCTLSQALHVCIMRITDRIHCRRHQLNNMYLLQATLEIVVDGNTRYICCNSTSVMTEQHAVGPHLVYAGVCRTSVPCNMVGKQTMSLICS